MIPLKLTWTLVLTFMVGCVCFGQQAHNMTLLDHWDGNSSFIYNDIWGYTHTDGQEYGIIGSNRYVHFLDINNTNDVVEIFRHAPGASSSWRDFKSLGTTVYGVTEGGEGLSIYDLSGLPDTIVFVKSIKADFTRAHNIFIDVPKKRLYVCGTRRVRQGLIVYDLKDPLNPVLIGTPVLNNFPLGPSSNNGYIHDLFVQKNIVYGSHGYGGFYMWDFKDPASPTLVGGINPGTGYNHSSWITKNNKNIIFAEEIPAGRPLSVIDISDVDDLNIINTIKDPLLAPTYVNNRPHNPYVVNDYLFASYYQDGVQVWDISDLMNPKRIAYYDTEPRNTRYYGYNNNWGVYPFLSDNKVIASDRQNGFFLLQLDVEALQPFEFIRFDARAMAKGVQLHWQTTNEFNVDHFLVERSWDGESFSSIQEVETNNLVGVNNYIFLDPLPEPGTIYYRITAVNVDGTTSHTNVERVDVKLKNSYKVYPNPTSGAFTVVLPSKRLTSKITVLVRDLSGRVVYTSDFNSESTSYIHIESSLPQGLYQLDILEDNARVHREKLLVVQHKYPKL